MKKAQPFEAYFNDNDLSEEKLARMRLTRQLVHTIYPDVQNVFLMQCQVFTLNRPRKRHNNFFY